MPGDLIDTVLRRGPRGFNVLMELIEYEYPEIYTKIMEKPARNPDPKERIDDIENELDMKHQQILELSEKVLELDNHNKELSEHKQQAQKERTEAVLQQEKLRRERDQYRDKGQELDHDLIAHYLNTERWNIMVKGDPWQSNYQYVLSKTIYVISYCNSSSRKRHFYAQGLMANICSAIKQYSKEKGHPKNSSKVYEDKSSDKDESKPLAHDDGLKKLKTIVSQLESKNEELLRDNRCLEEQLDKLAEQYDLFESSIFGYKEEVKCLKEERDQALHHFEELKNGYQTLQQENSDLKKTIMTDQSKLRVLKNENSAGRSRFRKCQLSTSQNMDCPDPNKKLQELEDNFESFYGHDSEDDKTGAT
ncbi:hypothetical protein LSH36_10g13037 [Paralvinella palmiformis]|uniref:Uncharacterized protein n=1 Tax=Paralvinella palmiformis TaxID=53620 RepID=A0AAD9KDS8_9ANNE|nr:hypothetical protein LSH36_10g13037 [Paralvinella palmiformis]